MKTKMAMLSTVLLPIISCSDSIDNSTIELGGDRFCVSKKYSILDQTKGAILKIKGSDGSDYGGSFQVSINPREVKKSIPDYFLKHGDFPASFIVNVSLSSKSGLNNATDKNYYADALQLVDNYENAKIEYDENNRFYRVSDWGTSPPFILWDVLKIKPDKNSVVPNKLDDYYIASCSRAGGATGVDGNSSICDYSVVIDNYLVKLTTTENNLFLKEQITKYTENILTSWRKLCD